MGQSSGGGYGGRGSGTYMAPRRGPVQYQGGAQPAGTFIPESKYGQNMGRIPTPIPNPFAAPIGAPPALGISGINPLNPPNLFPALNPDQNPLFPQDLFKAKGGPVDKIQPYIVGEEGPELFIPEVNGKIMPHKKTMEMLKPQFRRSGGPVQGYGGDYGYEDVEEEAAYISPVVRRNPSQFFQSGLFGRQPIGAPRGIGSQRDMPLAPASGPVEIGVDEIYRRYPWAPRNRQGLESFVDTTRQQAANRFAREQAGRAAVAQVYENQAATNRMNATPMSAYTNTGGSRIDSKYGTATATPEDGLPGMFGVTNRAGLPVGEMYPIRVPKGSEQMTVIQADTQERVKGLPNPMSRLKKKA